MTTLVEFVNMMILDVHDGDDGIVLELGPPGRRASRLVLLESCFSVVDITTRHPWTADDDEQAQVDIGDDLYEQERLSRYDDMGDEPEYPWRPEG